MQSSERHHFISQGDEDVPNQPVRAIAVICSTNPQGGMYARQEHHKAMVDLSSGIPTTAPRSR